MENHSRRSGSIAAATPRCDQPVPVTRGTAASLTVSLTAIVDCAFPPTSLSPPRRVGRPGVPLSKAVSIYLGHTVFGLSYTALGLAFGCDRTTARRLCHRIEDRREEKAFDSALGAIEPALSAWLTLSDLAPTARAASRRATDGYGERP